MEDEDISNKINIMFEMLLDRGYLVTDDIRDNVDNTIFTNMIDDSNKYVYVHISTSTFNKKSLGAVIEILRKKELGDDVDIKIIVVLPKNKKVSKFTNDSISDINCSNIEFFLLKDFTINVTKHTLVPKHTLISDEELTFILDKYKCTKKQLPKIRPSDPVIKYYGWKTGEVCKIERDSYTTGKSIYYRCIDHPSVKK
jgi:DNA-directed RNA polymerase subunit H (RpoH/RPB5)